MAFYFVSTFAIAQTPTKQPALRLSRTKNLHSAKATFPGFSAIEELSPDKEVWLICGVGQRAYYAFRLLFQSGYKAKILSGGMQTYLAKYKNLASIIPSTLMG
jgi:rhodanese-related sulfurtransferase